MIASLGGIFSHLRRSIYFTSHPWTKWSLNRQLWTPFICPLMSQYPQDISENIKSLCKFTKTEAKHLHHPNWSMCSPQSANFPFRQFFEQINARGIYLRSDSGLVAISNTPWGKLIHRKQFPGGFNPPTRSIVLLEKGLGQNLVKRCFGNKLWLFMGPNHWIGQQRWAEGDIFRNGKAKSSRKQHFVRMMW